jgi:cytoskeletal protein CcmA (bactofilin family)
VVSLYKFYVAALIVFVIFIRFQTIIFYICLVQTISNKQNMAKYIENEPNSHNTITAGTEITGDINSNGDIRLDGVLSGNINAKGKLVIGESGKVTGIINCKNSDIYGIVEGKLNVSELLALKSTAQIKGDIITSRLAIEPGCNFTGTCKMGDEKRGSYSGETEDKTDEE